MIQSLLKLTVYGRLADKARLLEAFQDLGCLHIVPLRHPSDATPEQALAAPGREALRFLRDSPIERTQFDAGPDFEAERVATRALQLKARMKEIEDRLDFLRARIAEVEPWGDFRFPELDELAGQRFWFFTVQNPQWQEFLEQDVVFQVMHRDNRYRYVVVVAASKPVDLPAERAHVGSVPLSDLKREFRQLSSDLEDLHAERFQLARWTEAFAESLAALEDVRARQQAALETFDDGPVFAAQAWVPEEQWPEVEARARELQAAVVCAPPEPDELPPTLLSNPEPLAGGEQLVRFYTTPHYREWDPSTLVFFSFALFFAIILGDAGYASLLGVVYLLVFRRLSRSREGRRFRNLLGALVGGSIAWGVVVGGYFGVTPSPDSLLGRLHVLDATSFSTMIPISIAAGIAHILAANLAVALKARPRSAAIAPFGWCLVLVGGALLFAANLWAGAPGWIAASGYGVMATGGVAILGWSGSGSPLQRLLGGLGGMAKLVSAFGDVLSYIRLFALGLASSSLAVSFNGLARQATDMESGFGFLLGLLILLVGHTLNFALCIMSGVVHGLRLNFIEFFNWSLSEEGRPFVPFERKEKTLWTHS